MTSRCGSRATARSTSRCTCRATRQSRSSTTWRAAAARRPPTSSRAGPADDYARFEGGDDDDRWDRDEWSGDDDDRDGGTVRLEVRLRDASVCVDGAFHGRQSTLRLAAGRHRIEVVHPGSRTVEREVDVRPGRTSEVEVDLVRN